MSYNHHLGLHIPLREGLASFIEDAGSYGVEYAQFFLAPSQRNSKNIKPTDEEIKAFVRAKNHLFKELFIHSSYWINPATGNDYRFNIAKSLLKKEIALAKKLEVPFLVLHPGSATWHKPTEKDPTCKQAGIERVAKMLNLLLKNEDEMTILLENTAHGNRTIGSDINDLYEIKKLLYFPERVGFCIDTAHAFAYGYEVGTEVFITMLNDLLGKDAIKLVHFNDSHEPQASKHDRHALPGHGLIDQSVMQWLLHHPSFKEIPKIIEVTSVTAPVLKENLAQVSAW